MYVASVILIRKLSIITPFPKISIPVTFKYLTHACLANSWRCHNMMVTLHLHFIRLCQLDKYIWPFEQIYLGIWTNILYNFDKCRFPILNCSLLWISGFQRLILQGWGDSGGKKKSQIRSFIKISICFCRKIWDYNFCEMFHLFVSRNVAFVEQRRHLQPANPFSRQPGCCWFGFKRRLLLWTLRLPQL